MAEEGGENMKCTKNDCNVETGADWKTLCLSHYRNRSVEEIREARQKKLDRKIARMKGKAEKLDQIGESEKATFNSYHGDITFFTQPNINTSRGRAFKRYREKVLSRYDKGMELQKEADELRGKAEWLEKQGAVVKGDAERKRQAKREEMDKIVSVGARVFYRIFDCEGIVAKVNKKTYTVQFDNGLKCAVEKVFVEPIK
jgi:hypothetical protein